MEETKEIHKGLNGHKKWFILGIVVVLIIIALLTWQSDGFRKVVTTFFGLSEKAVLKIVPASGMFEVGSEFTVDLVLDTNGNDVVAVGAYLEYDPTHIEVTDVDTTGSEFTTNNDCTSCKVLNYDNGNIELVLGKPTPGVNGKDIKLATITMKALQEIETDLSFEFTNSYEGKSRVILDDGQGTDILSGVEHAEFSLLTELPANPLRVKVDFEGISSGPVSMALEIKGAVNKSFNSTSREPSFDIPDVPEGSYTIEISAPFYLKKTMTNISLPRDEQLTATLLAGNLYDQDDIINSIDFSIMNAQWGFTNKPGSDINQDGIVNSIDFSFINKNWSMTSS